MITRKVIKGTGRGKYLSFPTVNLRYFKTDKIKFGVWAVLVQYKDKEYKGAAFVGPVPTFNIKTPRIEIHIFNFSKNLYNKKIRVRFLKYLRPAKKFKNPQTLVRQIKEDCNKILIK
ncbi:MAG: riboflavin kinase [Patescibacteria group bacterium]